MSPDLRAIAPFVAVNVVLIVGFLAFLLTGHHVVGFVLIVLDAVNLMALRWRMFRTRRRR